MARQCRVIERDLRVEADQSLGSRPVGGRLRDDREWIDLYEIRVVRTYRPDEAAGDRDGRLEVAAEAHREPELAGLEVEEAKRGVGVDGHDRVGALGGNLLDLDAPLGRAHQEDPPSGPVEDRR